MFLPKKHLQSAQGQILVLFLLILVLGLAIVLSVSSRVITDIRVTTTTDESNRAYFAAEAGIEEALRRLRDDPFTSILPFQLDFTNLNDTDSDTLVDVESTVDRFVYPTDLVRDEVAQINLLGDPTSLAPPLGFDPPTTVDIHWGNSTVNPPALEVSLIYCLRIVVCNPAALDNIRIRKFVFDPPGGISGNFCLSDSFGNSISPSSHDVVDSMTGQSKQFFYVARLNLENGVTPANCFPNNLPGMGPLAIRLPMFLRLRPIMDPPPALQPGVGVAVTSVADPLPAQGAVITSTGKTISGVTRKIRVIRLFPALPALFDYVLFSGGAGPIRK